MRKLVSGLLLCFAVVDVASAGEWVVEAHYADRAALQRAATHFQHVIIDKKRNVLRIETNEDGIAAIQNDGLAVTIDQAGTAKLRDFYSKANDAAKRGFGIDSIPGFECFRTVEETYATMDQLVTSHPNIAAIDEIGPSWKKTQNPNDGYTMRAMHITNFDTLAGDPDRPKMAVYSSIHAREYAPAEVDTRFAEWLVNNYNIDPEATWLVDHNDFHLVLMANPDARKDAEQQIYQRKNLDTINGPCGSQDEFSQPGVDLNRNFPWHWNILLGGGSEDDTCGQTFHGPYADGTDHNDHIQGEVEPETINLFQYVAGTCDSAGNCTGGLFADRRVGPMDPPTTAGDGNAPAPVDTTGIFFDIHSNAALVLWPWGDTSSDSPNAPALQTLGRRIAYFNGYTPQQSNELYFTDGTTDDSMYGLLGVASYTIETNGFDFFEDCETFDGNTSPTNIAALRYAARTLHAPYQLPSGPDTIDVSVSTDLIVPGDPLSVTAHLDSSRFNQSNGTEPVRNIAAASAYVDVLPWDTDAIVPLTAADGAFDSSVETAIGSIDTSSLPGGRHFVYVQGSDASAHDGTPNAAFFTIADPSEIATVTGQVTDHATGDPVVAQVSLFNDSNGESHLATSDEATGDYSAHAFPGTFDFRVAAPHYMAQTMADVDLAAGQTLTENFSLYPDCVVFADDMESGGTAWTAQSPWTLTTGAGSDTTHVWNTPNYGDNLNRSLTTANAVDLTGYADATLDFDDRCQTESGYDYGYVEFSVDNGSNWTGIYSCTGQSSWQSHHVELPVAVNGAASVKLRFRLQSDGFNNDAGWMVDNVRFAAGGPACLAQQQVDEIFANGFEP